MQFTLHISDDNFQLLEKHAEEMLPSEAVALLFGTSSGLSVSISRVELMDNTSPATLTSFSVDPESEYNLLMHADERGEALVGIFHSHPAPPRPSATDKNNMRLNPVVWLIASKLTGVWVINGYVLDNDKILEVTINVSGQDD